MSDAKPDEIAIFAAAAELSGDAREAFLDEACHGNDELRSRLARYLLHGEQIGPLDEAHSLVAATIRTENIQHVGNCIGPYKLHEQIGEGGMGIVYVAKQTKPVKRKVALKIIKPGMASREVVARFEAERQALAMMEHPNIARVFDGGVTDSGQPYFVMELAQGLPITEYCDQHQLATAERLRLFIATCQAVQHAHQRGIIHRDLKPSNVIVARIDDTAVPKVIDFGVAKAVSQALTKETVYTHFSQLVGTPLYMSPEQTELGVVDVDTRSDVYSLGVLLYELLTGRTPFDRDKLKRAGFDEMRRIIREDEPPKPSTMVSTLSAEVQTTVSEHRRSEPRKLSVQLEGELDWLVMKAMEKDRNRRYESASSLAADIERFLTEKPVEACPPSIAYKTRKFVRRNRGPVAAAAGLAVCLLIGLAGTSVGLVRANAQAARAILAEEAATLDRDHATTARRQADQARRDERRLNLRMAFDRGLTLCDQGYVGRGMLWMVRALELATDEDTAMECVIRANLTAWRRELHTLEAILPHTEGVLSVAVTPNGQLVLTASKDRRAQLWDMQTGNPFGEPLLHDGDVHEVAFTRDGGHVLTASFDQTVRLWKTDTGERIRTFQHQGNVPAATFAHNDSYIVTGCFDKSLTVWSTDNENQMRELPTPHGHTIHDVDVSRDGTRILTACHDKNVRVCDFESGAILATFKHNARVPAAAFSRTDGSQIVTGDSDGNVFLWDVAVAISQDDKTLEASAGEFHASWRHQGGVHRLRVSPDKSQILTASFDNTAQLLDAETLAPLGAALEHQAAVQGVGFAPSSSLVATACEDNAARLWQPSAVRSLPIVKHECGNHEAIFTSDGCYILTKRDDDTVYVHEAETATQIARFQLASGIHAVAVSPDGSNILIGTGANAQLWDATTSTLTFPAFEHAGGVWAVAFSADGERMLTGGFRGTVQLRDVNTGALIGDALELGTRVWGVSFSRDGTQFAVASGDKLVRTFDTRMGNIPRPLARHQDAAVAVVFSPDGSRVATGSHDNTVRIWEAATGGVVSAPMQHRGPIWYPTAVSFSPDGNSIVTGCDDRTVRIWDVETAKPIGPALVHEAGVRMVAFTSPSKIVTGTATGTVRNWQPSITPMNEDVQQITVWLEAVTGMELDIDGEINVLDTRSWQQRRRRLDELGGVP